MTPGARVQAAITVLDAWLAGAAIEQALTNWARGARYAGSGDRAGVRDHVYDVLRARGTCAALGGGQSGRALMIGLLRWQGQDLASVFNGVGHAPPSLDAAEIVPPGAMPAPEVDVPDWLVPLLQAGLGTGLGAVLDQFRQRAPLYLRVNTRKARRADVIARLAAEGITAIADEDVATALLVTSGARRIKSCDAYADGWLEPQDLSVQRALAAIDWPKGRILDFCAGGGGKALAIAAASDAQVLAHDALPRRMADLPVRAGRAGVRIDLLAPGAAASHAPYAAVLCDVPCSGSGTWRRDPEAKWRLTPERLAELQALQASILGQAAPLVAPGGQLIYMTCSLFRDENEAQITAFLTANPGWRLAFCATDTPLTASDGFFHAVLTAPGA